MNREEILSTASQYITKDRYATHGDAEKNFENVADLWNWWMQGRDRCVFDGLDVSMMMVLFKIARIKGNPTHVDSYVDAVGYLAIAGEIQCMER
jgi:hypothetical protein